MVRDKTVAVAKVDKKQHYFYNTSKLGEVLMETMLQESSEFCKIEMQQNWASQAHQQVFCYSVFSYIVLIFSNS